MCKKTKSYDDIDLESVMEEANLLENNKELTVEVMQERLKATEVLLSAKSIELEKAQDLNFQLINSISKKIDTNIKHDKLKKSLELLTQQSGVIQISVKKFPTSLHDKLTQAKNQSKIGAVTSYIVQATLEKMIREEMI